MMLIWNLLTFISFVNVHCEGEYLKIEIGDPCGNPHGSGRWMNKNNTFGCDQCDAGEYRDSYNNTCSACTGSLTSCKPNVLSSSCSHHWRDCETTSPSTTTRNVSTDKPVINTSSNIHSTTSVEHITSPTSTKKITNANIRPITSASFQSSFTSSTTVKTSVEHSEKTHLEPWVYVIIVRGLVFLIVFIAILIFRVYKHRTSQQSRRTNDTLDNLTDSGEKLLENSQA
uniref:uncharacterized protein LOC120341283 n=1 Tax=Styela clava TaxID=7725 RepID=UPI00193A0744|nr:uncharacterized protein LOC120341283 [Styela clava]